MELEVFEIEESPKPTLALVQTLAGEILKPDGEFERGRLALRSEYLPIVQMAASITEIDDTETYERVVQLGRMLQAITNKIIEFYKPSKQAFDQAKEIVLQQERSDMNQVAVLKTTLGDLVLDYDQKQEMLRKERQAVEKAAVAKDEEEARIAAAKAAEAVGDYDGALRILESQQLTTPVIVPRSAPKKTAGKVSRVKYKAQVDDLAKLISAVASGAVPIMALKADQGWLDKRADADREGFSVPGCSITRTEKAHFRE